jgi:dihydrodipicolinate reductase
MVSVCYASDDKPDVPSGTSRELAETLAQVRGLTPAPYVAGTLLAVR